MEDKKRDTEKDRTKHLEEQGRVLDSAHSSKFGASGPKDETCGSHEYLSKPSTALNSGMNIADAEHAHGSREGDGHQYSSVPSYECESYRNEKKINMQTGANPTGAFSNLEQLRNLPPTPYQNSTYLGGMRHSNSAPRQSVHPNTIYTENRPQIGLESARRSPHQTDIPNIFYAHRDSQYHQPRSAFETSVSQHSHFNHYPQRFIPIDPASTTYEHMNPYLQYDPARSAPWTYWIPNQPQWYANAGRIPTAYSFVYPSQWYVPDAGVPQFGYFTYHPSWYVHAGMQNPVESRRM